MWIPSDKMVARQPLALLTDSVADCDPLQATGDACVLLSIHAKTGNRAIDRLSTLCPCRRASKNLTDVCPHHPVPIQFHSAVMPIERTCLVVSNVDTHA